MKRIFLFAMILLSAAAVKAQSASSPGFLNGMPPAAAWANHAADSSLFSSKWSFTKYASISTGFVAFNRGGGSFLSAPLGLQVTRQLTNNIYAFGGLSVAPTYFRYNSMPYQGGLKAGMGNMNSSSFGVYPMAQMGLMYTNEQRTFSISGSVSVSRSSYGGYPAFYGPASGPVFNNYQR